MEITLAYLNELRAMNGKAPLKAWKESKDKLAATIDKEHELRVALQAEDDRATARDEAAAAEARIERVNSSAKNKPIKLKTSSKEFNDMLEKENDLKIKTAEKLLKQEVAKAAQVPAKDVNKKINISAIAKELGVNPKVARAKLRKANIDRTNAEAVRKALTR